MISVLICTANRAEDLDESLKSIHQSLSKEPAPLELVVVDNGSTDETPALLNKWKKLVPPLRVIRHEARGLSRARQAGIAAAQGDVILFTDDDVRVPEKWVSRMTEPLFSARADAVCGGVYICPKLVAPWMTPEHRSYLASTETIDQRDPQRLVGANMAFHRRILEKVEGFDVELGAGALGFMEDSLFSRQLKVAGYKIASALKVQVEHHPRVERFSRQSWLERSIKQGVSQAYVDHHWEHRKITFPVVRALKHQARLSAFRLTNPALVRDHAVGLKELNMVRVVAYFSHYRKEQKRPRNYNRRGFAKIRSEVGEERIGWRERLQLEPVI